MWLVVDWSYLYPFARGSILQDLYIVHRMNISTILTMTGASHSSGGHFTIANKCWCRMKFPPLLTWSARVANLVESHCRAVSTSEHSQVRILPHLGSQRLKRRSKLSGRVKCDFYKFNSSWICVELCSKHFDIRSESGLRLNHAVHFSAHQEVGEGQYDWNSRDLDLGFDFGRGWMGLVGRVNVTAYPLQYALTQKCKHANLKYVCKDKAAGDWFRWFWITAWCGKHSKLSSIFCKCNIKVVRQCSKESSYLAGASLADSNAAADEPEQVDDCVTSQI